MKTPRALALCRAIYRHRKPPEDETGPRVEIDAWLHSIAFPVENRRVAPLYCRGNAAVAAFPRQYQGLRSLVFVSGSPLVLAASWYVPFLVFSSEYSSDVRKSLDSMYLLDDPLLGLQVMRI